MLCNFVLFPCTTKVDEDGVSTSLVLLDERVGCAKPAGGEGGGRKTSSYCGGTDIGGAGTGGGEGGGSV